MPYIIHVDRNSYDDALKEWMIKIPFSLIEENDIRQLSIGDGLYFYITGTDSIIGPYLATSRAFMVYPEDNPCFNEKTCCLFISPGDKPVESIPVQEKPEFGLSDKEIQGLRNALPAAGEIQKKDNSDSEMSIVLVDESDFIFTMTHIRGHKVSRLVKKFSQGWFKELLSLKEKIVAASAKNEQSSAGKYLSDFTDLMNSFLITGNEDFYQGFAGRIRLITLNRANLIPFNWLFHPKFPWMEANPVLSRGFINVENTSHFVQPRAKPYSVLIITDPTMTLPSAQEEGRRLFDYFTQSGWQADMVSRELNYINVKNFFEKYDCIHFIGHGEGGWKIARQKILSAEKVPVFKKCPFLVVSHSCRTSLHLGDTTLVETFLQRGVKWVVASELDIPDRNYFDYFKIFYDDVITGKMPDEALNHAVAANREEKKLDWIYFNIFGNE